MAMTKTKIALIHNLILAEPSIVPDSLRRSAETSLRLAATLQAELMNLGYILDRKAYGYVTALSEDAITRLHKQIIPTIKATLGDTGNKPFYPNFPQEVMAMDEVHLFLNAFVHYLTDGTWSPPQEMVDRGHAIEQTTFKTIFLGTNDDFLNIFTAKCSMNQAMTPQDAEIVDWFVDNNQELRMPSSIPFKETLCKLAAKKLDVPIRTVTDVLRIAVYLSGGDISLPKLPIVSKKGSNYLTRSSYFRESIRKTLIESRKAFQFKKFTRSQRKYLLGLLEKTNLDLGEMQSRYGRWLRLGEILHPNEYARKFTKTARAFLQLRNQYKYGKIRTFAGMIDLALRKSLADGLDVLASRPGEFARRLDWLIRTNLDNYNLILGRFGEVGGRVSSKVLVELANHFHGRRKNKQRKVMLKKGSKNAVLKDLPALPASVVDSIVEMVAGLLRDKTKGLKPLGKVWIDPALSSLPLPSGMRSANTGVNAYIRGARIKFDAKKVIRGYIHWYDQYGTIDIDLSCALYSEDLKQKNHISYTNLKDGYACHSGDIRHRAGRNAEYIDLDIEKCRKAGIRYAIFHAFNFDGHPLADVPECVFGTMHREFPESDKIFRPDTIDNAIKVANQSTSAVICAFDLETSEMIWLDLESDRQIVESFTVNTIAGYIQEPAFSVADLLRMHAETRGEIVERREDADLIFTNEQLAKDYTTIANYISELDSKREVVEVGE